MENHVVAAVVLMRRRRANIIIIPNYKRLQTIIFCEAEFSSLHLQLPEGLSCCCVSVLSLVSIR